MSHVEIVSFGYGHAPAPKAHFTIDVQHHFKDPHVDPALRHFTAEDPRVVEAVLDTSGIRELILAIVDTAEAFRRGPQPGPIVIAVGCRGGRHRSATLASEAARRLHARGIPVTVHHRDISLPVIERAAHGRARDRALEALQA